jgi:hypothetical protein
MVRLFGPLSMLLLLLATACAGSSSSPGSAAPAATSAPAAPQPAAQPPAQASASGWTRPGDVTPLTDLSAAGSVGGKAASGAGAFQVISQTPWPGDKVRVFFFGVQG